MLLLTRKHENVKMLMSRLHEQIFVTIGGQQKHIFSGLSKLITH